MKWTDILFDLDGTLTDPGKGITNSIKHALTKMGRPIPEQKVLESCIGPPLNNSFRDIWGFNEEETVTAMNTFREYFTSKGIHENKIIEGIPQLLQHLSQNGARLYLATSKPTVFAKQVLENFNLTKYFTYISGSKADHVDHTKAEIVANVLSANNIDPKNAVMVGDRKFDVEGAHANNIPCIGVLFGYGSRQEFETAGADYIAKDMPGLENLLF